MEKLSSGYFLTYEYSVDESKSLLKCELSRAGMAMVLRLESDAVLSALRLLCVHHAQPAFAKLCSASGASGRRPTRARPTCTRYGPASAMRRWLYTVELLNP